MADRYFVNGGVDNNWSSTSNWSLTDGGAGGQAVPLSTDDVFFTALSPNCTVNGSLRVSRHLNFTGYTNTITMTFGIQTSGSIMTFSPTMGILGTGAFTPSVNATLTSNGKTIPVFHILQGIFTLADNFTVGRLVVGSLNAVTINGFQITVTGNFDRSPVVLAGSTCGGTTNIIMTGTGNILFPALTTVKLCTNNFTIASTANVTFPSGTLRYDTGTFTVEAGATVNAPADLDVICAAATTWNTGGLLLTFRDVSLTLNFVYTFTTNLHCRDLTCTNAGGGMTLNGSEIRISRNFSHVSTTGTLGGTATLALVGTGDFTTAITTTGRISNPIKIDSTGGTITFASAVTNINMGAFNLVAGKVVLPSGATLYPKRRRAAVAQYKLDGNANDSIGSNNGTATNVTYVAGQIGQAGTFNGTTSRIDTSTSAVLAVSDGTASCWFKGGVQGSNCRLLSLAYDVNNRAELIVNGSSLLGFVVAGGSTVGNISFSIGTTGIWHHAAVTWGVSGTRLYLDGVLVASSATVSTVAWPSSPFLRIGYYAIAVGFSFAGDIDDVRIYNYALTADEVQAVINGTDVTDAITNPGIFKSRIFSRLGATHGI